NTIPTYACLFVLGLFGFLFMGKRGKQNSPPPGRTKPDSTGSVTPTAGKPNGPSRRRSARQKPAPSGWRYPMLLALVIAAAAGGSIYYKTRKPANSEAKAGIAESGEATFAD